MGRTQRDLVAKEGSTNLINRQVLKLKRGKGRKSCGDLREGEFKKKGDPKKKLDWK